MQKTSIWQKAGRLALLLTGLIGLAGCFADGRHPVLEEGMPEFTSSEFEPACQVEGVTQRYLPFRDIWRWWGITSGIDKQSGAISHVLWFNLEYDGHGFMNYRAARDDMARSLPVSVVKKKHLSCNGHGECGYEEVLNIPISEAVLRASVSSGFRIKLFSEGGGNLVFEFLPEQISKQLMVVDKSAGECRGPTGAASSAGGVFPGSGPFAPGRLGVGYLPLDARGLAGQHIASDYGTVILILNPDAPAARAGLAVGDVLLEFNGAPLRSLPDLPAAVASVPAGGKARVHLWRSGTMRDVEVQF